MEESIKVSAPGRLILHGEHALMYGNGKRAIVSAVDIRTYVTLKTSDDFVLKFKRLGIYSAYCIDTILDLKDELPSDFNYETLNDFEQIPVSEEVRTQLEKFCDEQVKFKPSDREKDMGDQQKLAYKAAQKKAFSAALFLYLAIWNKPADVGAIIEVETDLSTSAGMGASASFGAALATALLLSAGKLTAEKLDRHLINRWAQASETLVHESMTGLGVDNTLATYGGGGILEKGKEMETIENFPNLRIIVMDIHMYRNPRNVRKKLFKLRETKLAQFQTHIDGIGNVTEAAISELQKNRVLKHDLITKNHGFIKTLDLSHWLSDCMIGIAEKQGFGAKVTGSKGDICVFIYIPEKSHQESLKNVLAEIKKSAMRSWDTITGAEGVRVEEC